MQTKMRFCKYHEFHSCVTLLIFRRKKRFWQTIQRQRNSHFMSNVLLSQVIQFSG